MNKDSTINLNVTSSQKETLELRMSENGFDDISAYLKVVALKTQPFILTSDTYAQESGSIVLSFEVTEAQKAKLDENFKKSSCESLEDYLRYIALYGVITSVVEVRSTGNLDTMLKRITESRNASKPKKLF